MTLFSYDWQVRLSVLYVAGTCLLLSPHACSCFWQVCAVATQSACICANLVCLFPGSLPVVYQSKTRA